MSMIRVLFCTLLAAWAVLPLRADDRGRALVRSLSAKIASYASYEVLFTADMDGEFDGVQGRIVVSGDRYRVEVNGSELYCDGKLLYTFRADEDEVTIERPDPGERSLLSNPPRFFRLEGDDFEVAYKGREDAGGRSLDRLELTPKSPDAGYRSIEIGVDPADGMPVQVVYRVDGAAAPLRIRIDRLVPNVPVKDSDFTFDPQKHPGVEVIDFR